jgi:hypothetical protein
MRRPFTTSATPANTENLDNNENQTEGERTGGLVNARYIKNFSDEDKLNEENWIDWSDQMDTMLDMCNVKERLSTDAILDASDREKEKIALYLIKNNITKEQRTYVRQCKSAMEMYQTLQRQHVKGHVSNRVRLMDELLGLKMGDDDDPSKFIQKLKLKIEELMAISVMVDPVWQCCLLLRALPEKYNMIRVSLDAVEGDPDMQKIQAMIQNEYTTQRKYSRTGEHNSASAMVANKSRRREKRKCGNCKQYGFHDDADCFDLPENASKKALFIEKKSFERAHANLATSSVGSFWALVAGQIDEDGWIADTGATMDHMSGNIKLFDASSFRTIPDRIVGTAGNDLIGNRIGKITLELTNGTISFDCLFVPGLKANLLSIGKILDNDAYRCRELSRHKLSIWSKDRLVLNATRKTDLWWLDTKPMQYGHKRALIASETLTQPQRKLSRTSQPQGADIELLHRRLGHVNLNDIRRLSKSGVVGCQINDPKTDWGIYFCDACIEAKQHTEGRNQTSFTRATRLLELIHSDLSGPIETKARNNAASYILTFIDDYSRFTVIFLIPNKEAATIEACFVEFMVYAERETGCRLLCVRVDGGNEYRGIMTIILKRKGIRKHTTNPDKPHENGVAERYNRTIWEGTRAVIAAQRVPKVLWGDAAVYMSQIKNCLPHSALDGKTPFEIYHGRKPNLSNIRVFGCPVYIKVVGHLKKLDSRTKIGTFIGMAEGTRGWKILTANGKITTSKDVIFVEAPMYIPKDQIEDYLIDIPWQNSVENDQETITDKATEDEKSLSEGILQGIDPVQIPIS